MWDIMAKDGSFFQAGGYNLSELDSFDKEQIMKQHQNARQAMITGPVSYTHLAPITLFSPMHVR